VTRNPRGKAAPGAARKTGILLVACTSEPAEASESGMPSLREPGWRRGGDCVVSCFLEHGRPDLAAAVRQLIRRGCNHLVVHTLSTASDKQFRHDVSRLLRKSLDRHSHVTFEFGEAMYGDPGLTDLVEQRLAKLLAGDNNLV
jgi:sirohydrochlorin ferrochelatase